MPYNKIALAFLFVFCTFASKAQLSADFTSYPSPAVGCVPLVVQYSDASTGESSFATFYWDLGNSTTSTLQNPSTTYTAPGTYTVKLTVTDGSHSSTKTITSYVTVYDTPGVKFSGTPLRGCPSLNVNFTDASTLKTSGSGTYLWDFGDGSSSTIQNSSHSYSSGLYNVTLVVTNSKGCVNSATKTGYVLVFEPPVAGFYATNTFFCSPPAADTFISTSSTSNPPLTYLWRFGDGGSSAGTNPGHIYTASGTYSVKLIVTDSNHCEDSVTILNYIHITKPTANFSTTVTNACFGDSVLFTNTSTGDTTSYWYFSDGGTAGTRNAKHPFTKSGIDTITLVVFNGFCYDTVKKTINIYPQHIPGFTVSPTYPCWAPVNISFINTSTKTVSYTWNFGDGSSPSTSTNPTHTYTSNGFFEVTLTATDSNGCKASYSDTVRIYDMIVEAIYYPNNKGCKPLTVDFSENLITNVPYPKPFTFPSSYPLTYHWDFGDGGTANTALTSHTYTDTGIFIAHLTVTEPGGCSKTDSIIILVGIPPTPSFYPLHDTVCAYFPDTFKNTSTGADTYRWTYGDYPTPDDVTDGTHAYGDTGWYTVTLTAFYKGCADSVKHRIYILGPVPVFKDAPICPNSLREYVFNDSGSFLMDSFEWHLSDSTTNNANRFYHTFPRLGSYKVTLIAHNNSTGCTDSTYKNVDVISTYITVTALTDTNVCRDQWVSFRTDIYGGDMTGFFFQDFIGDSVVNSFGQPSGGTVAYWQSDTMKIRGYHTISVQVKDTHKCLDSTVKIDYVNVAKPIAGFKASPLMGCKPMTVYFTDTSSDVPGATITNRRWAFGTGDTLLTTSLTNSYTYTDTGTDSVQLMLTDNIGCKDTLTKHDYITVLHPIADFTASKVNPCPFDSVRFTNKSFVSKLHDTVSSYTWDFGDGTNSTLFSPLHYYTTTGSFTVRLIVRDVNGCADTMTKTAYINISKPHASFTMSDSVRICPPLVVLFTNTSSGYVSDLWDFGDGGISRLTNPSHTFSSSKYFTVTLICMNTNGCFDTAYGHVNIYGYAGGLKYFPLVGCVPLLVNFTASITNAPTILWDFNDGVTASASGTTTTTHLYRTPGAYVPKLILGDGKGCKSSSIGLDTIKVDDIIAGFWPKTPCVNDTVHITDTSKSYFSSVVTWRWTFDGGPVDYSKTPALYFTSTGVHTITMFVQNANGCKDSLTGTFTIQPPPDIDAGPDTVICIHDTAILSPSGGLTYLWWSASYLSCNNCTNPEIAPTSDTTWYYVKGMDIYGCKNYDSVKVSLQIKTTAFVDPPPPICQGEGEHLHAFGAQHYSWLPADGLDSPDIGTPYADPNDTVNYIMIATEGTCIPDTEAVTLIVHKKPIVNAGEDQTIIGGNTAQLQGRGTYVDVYLWTPSATLSCTSCTDPVAKPIVTTIYALIGTSEYGCKDTDSVRINVLCDKSQVFIPNAFTPNGDGENDKFYPRGVAISTIKVFRVFNRWGEIVYEKMNFNINDENSGWDGTYNGVKQDPGVYVYMMDAVCETGEEIVWKGDVTIIR
jgi:gliding motility-associated-like protein